MVLAAQLPFSGAWLASPHLEQYLEPPMTAPQSAQPPVPLLSVHSSTQEPPPLILVSSVYLRTFPAGQLRHLPAPAAVHEAHEGSHGLQTLPSA